MRNFSWKYFTLTGDVEAFMLYKEMERQAEDGVDSQDEDGEEAVESDGTS